MFNRRTVIPIMWTHFHDCLGLLRLNDEPYFMQYLSDSSRYVGLCEMIWRNEATIYFTKCTLKQYNVDRSQTHLSNSYLRNLFAKLTVIRRRQGGLDAKRQRAKLKQTWKKTPKNDNLSAAPPRCTKYCVESSLII